MTAPLPQDHPSWAIRMEAKLDRLVDDQDKMTVDVSGMRERIYGNGKPGLIQDVREARNLAQKALDMHSARDRILGTLGGVLLTLVIGLLWSIFTGQWRLVIP